MGFCAMSTLATVTFLCLVNLYVNCQAPSSFYRTQFYPTKNTNDPKRSEVLQCRSIRDVIKRNTARYRKVLVRNDNPQIDFAYSADNKYMTSRAKSKLDVLASRVRNQWNSGVKLRVIKAWTDNVDKSDMLSLHYEGRTLKLQISDGDRNKLGKLCGLAAESGFDWIYYEDYNYIRVSVIPDVCQTKLDMAFVIDTSGSVGYSNFQKVQQFLKKLVDFYNIGLDQTRLGLVSYSYSVHKEFYLNTHSTKSSIKTAIDQMMYEGSMTATGDALIQMKNYIFNAGNGMRGDKSIPKVGILLTDGRSNRGQSVSSAARAVKSAGINMFVIGVGGNLRQSELNDVASDPDNEHVFRLNGFYDLSGFVDQMSTTSCDEGAQLSQCESAETAVDGGSFKYFRGSFSANTAKVTIEVEDKGGRSYLYTSLINKNPGPLDLDRETKKNTDKVSPRALSVTLSSTRLLYIAVQGQEDKNRFILNIWDSLFPNDEYKYSVLENQPAGRTVATIQSDKSGYLFHYSIHHGNNAGHFSINKYNGEVKTTRQLDREHIAKYSLVIVAQDANLKCHQGRTLLTVTVTDQNDNDPRFIGDPYMFTIREDYPAGNFIGSVSATDADAGNNGKLRYSIKSGTGKDDFSMNANTGEIRSARSLDYDKRQKRYDLRVLVQDSGSPVKSDEAVLTINIQDVNEPPMFTGDCAQGCSVSINEGNAINRAIKTLTATDPDTSQQCTLQYEIVSSDKYYFKIGRTSGLVQTSRPIDRELKDVYLLMVDVRDCSDPPLKDRTTITVTALDVNDNEPVFPVDRYTANVMENKPQGTRVIQVAATDLDAGTNKAITYSFESGNSGGHFRIDVTSGLITTAKQLDREAVDKFILKVCATDGGNPSKKSCVFVDVTVGDQNDNAPEFVGNKNFVITENVRRGTKVGTVGTKDKDAGINAKVRCSIVGGNAGNAFSIDAASCAITTGGVIDRESIEAYSLQIRIADLGQPSLSATATYTVIVQDENDNSPVFTSGTYRVTVKENTVVGTSVKKVSAQDKDHGTNGKIKYSIESGDDAVAKFEIDLNNGDIRLKAALSFGVRNSYRLKLKAEDSAANPRSGSAYVVITVQDTNDYAPIFSPSTYSKSISEGASVGTSIVKVTATDQDTGPSGILAYSIESGNVNNAFMIVSQTGEIKINRKLDYEGVKSYSLRIKAKDNGSPSLQAFATVNIAVTDENDNRPIFASNPFRMSVLENAARGFIIGKISASDKDSGMNSRLSYLSTSTGVPFLVDANGDVKVNSALDFETTKKYVINVKVSDAGNPVLSATSQIVVDILDSNDNQPQFTRDPYTCEILENSPPSSAVCYVHATDADSGNNAKLRYILTASSGSQCPFTVDQNTGQVKTQQSLDRETTSSYTCTVTATDAGQPTKSNNAQVTINVKDENDNAPEANPTSYTFHITEEQDTDLTAGSVLASDKDIGENKRLVFSLTGGATSTKIDATSGSISAVAKLDREADSSYTMNVKVSDNGIPSLFANVPVTVIVDDINDNRPVFSKTVYTSRIREDSAIGSNIIQVSATDADAGTNADITYEITGGMYHGNFSIDSKTGLITTKLALDYEAISSYELTVTAKDAGTPQKKNTCKVAISVVNVDDNAPEFGKITEAKVSEGVQIGTPVVKFNATDKDGSALTYSIMHGNTGSAFEIDVSTGQLRVKNSLDRETTAKYNITVTVKDSSNKVTTTHLPIKVLDINDNAPQFHSSQYSRSLPENRPVGRSVIRVLAFDIDEGTNGEVVYEIESGLTKDQFTIKQNGDIETTRSLDREDCAVHHLVVAAKDKGTPSLKTTIAVTVTVRDVNDNAPIFDLLTSKQITENCGVGATVAVIRATDKDAGDNARIAYTILSENGGQADTFEIGSSDGVLKTKKDLDRETLSFYTLEIKATDNPKYETAKVTSTVLNVTVLDENDNSPVITAPVRIPPVREDVAVNYLVTKFEATDKDIGVNAVVDFNIISGNTENAFSIDSNTGELKIAKMLDREKIASYQLEVRAEDTGKPALRSTKTFVVTVEDVNDNGPTFTQTKFKTSINENVPQGTSVVTVTATDPDDGSNSQITYRLDGTSSAAAFSINSTSGKIVTASAIDYETTKVYKFKAIATDGKFRASADVEIDVGNLNDNSPSFGQTYSVEVPESSAVSSRVIVVTATDIDSFGAITYSLTNNTGTFSIDSQSGEIKTTVGLDRETRDAYIIGVSATDGGSPSLSAQTAVTVNVGDINDNIPYFAESSATVSINENEIVQSFFTVHALDKDIGVNAQLVYRIVNSGSSNKFVIDQNTGKVSTSVKLDREQVSSHVITIVANDKGQPSLESQPFTLSINVIDVNDNAPLFLRQYNNESISEGASIGAGVFGALAKDLDTGVNAEIEYSISGGNIGNVFKIDNSTGVVSLGKKLDRETIDKYTIQIQAKDHGKPPMNTTVTVIIHVTDENDNAPVFDKQTLTAYVYENKNAKTTVVRVIATDKDVGENARVEYSLKSNDAFTINAVTGEVTTLKPLDREEKAQYIIEVTAKDHGIVPLSTTEQLTINIADEDDNCPIFSPKVYTARIEENAPRGTIVVNVTATDDDIGPNAELRYAIKSGDDQGGFTVDPVTGTVTVVGIVDREYSNLVHLKVRGGKIDCGIKPANDTNVGEGGTEQANNQSLADVFIRVTDKNDNAPIFQKKNLDYYFKNIAEKNLLNLTANDPDLGLGGIVKFRLNSTNRVDEYGAVRREVIVEAYDQGSPSLSSRAVVKVHNQRACSSMSFDVTEDGMLSTATLCLFNKMPEGTFKRLVGKPFSLQCEASGNEPVMYRWLKDGNSIAAWSSSGLLEISAITKNDAGSYACLATNGGGTIQSTNAELIVQETPKFLKHPEPGSAEIGGTAVFECEATADPAPYYRWYKNNEIYQQGVGFRTKRLELPNVIPNDEGEYFCEAINIVGKEKSNVATLKVFERKTVLTMEVDLDNPNKEKTCHFFIPTSFEKILNDLTKKTVAVTKFDNKKVCNVTACQPNPCGNKGKCDLTKKGFHCSCKGGWNGTTCKDDVNECDRGSGDCLNGKCNNIKGSYWCGCPTGKTGRNCQLFASVCAGNPCASSHICVPLPNGPAGNKTCIHEEHQLQMTLELGDDATWQDHKKYIVEEDLNEIVQNWKPINSRKRRSVSSNVDIRACVVRITRTQKVEDDKVEIKFVFICPKDLQSNITIDTSYWCKHMLKSFDSSVDCKVHGQPVATKAPDSGLPVVDFEIEIVIRDKSTGIALGADEALDLLQQKDVLAQLSKKNMKVRRVSKAYQPEKQKGGKGSTDKTTAIAASVGVIACLALVALGAYIYMRKIRRHSDSAPLTMSERMAQRRQSKEDLLRADISMSNVESSNKNRGYEGDQGYRESYLPVEDTFMIDAPAKINKESKAKRNEQLEALPWYKGQLQRKQVEAYFEQCDTPGSYMAYKSSSDVLTIAVKSPEGGPQVHHLELSMTSNGGYVAKFGNNEPVTRDGLLEIIEHFQVSPINFGDTMPDVVFTEPWLRTSL